MRSREQLEEILLRLEGRGYKAYRDLRGSYDFGEFVLSLDHIQGDPFAAPSRLSVRLCSKQAAYPAEFYARKIRRVALADYLTRRFRTGIQRFARGNRGTGPSGLVTIDCGGQEVLERNSVVVSDEWIEARFRASLPARGRRILGRQAAEMLLEEVPRIVQYSLPYASLPAEEVSRHIQVVEDQQALRDQLEERNLVAFVGNESILPRLSGVDDRPLLPGPDRRVIRFQSPPQLEVVLSRPHLGPIRGMGIPPGVTLIVGGGFHGKSTLLRALERAVYNHIPEDGREWCVTLPTAVKIRAEDGRFVENVDISPFIRNLPFGADTRHFSTENASGSTSQAANIMEALEMGARLLLIDEDTSATNFMVRDARMQNLVERQREPITPLVDKIRQLYEDHGVSSVLVMGGCGDYFDVADTVILMDEYRPMEVTERVREIVRLLPSQRRPEGGRHFGTLPERFPSAESFDPRRGRKAVKIDLRNRTQLRFGRTELDLTALEQLVEEAQTRAVGAAIHHFGQIVASQRLSLREGLECLDRELEEKGLDLLSPYRSGDLARPRILEVAFAINRMRSLKVESSTRSVVPSSQK